MTLTKETFRAVFEAADACFLSSKQIQVAAVGQGAAAGDQGGQSLDETLPAFSNQNLPQVAAVANRGIFSWAGRGRLFVDTLRLGKVESSSIGRRRGCAPHGGPTSQQMLPL